MKKYKLVPYMKIDTEGELLSLKEAEAEKEQQKFLFPENIYKIEEQEDLKWIKENLKRN